MEADSYAQELLRYVHLNPVRPRDKRAAIDAQRWRELNLYRWSSHRAYAGMEPAPPWLALDWQSYFGGKRLAAEKTYTQFLRAAFGAAAVSPWADLRGTLALGGKAFFGRVAGADRGHKGAEEAKWYRREVDGTRREARARKLARAEPERAIQVWLRVIGGGERRSVVARKMGYADGSAITHMLRRMERHRQKDAALKAQLKCLQQEQIEAQTS